MKMRKIINFILSAVMVTTSFATLASCNFGGTSNDKVSEGEIERYAYTDGVHDYTAPERANDYMVRNGTTDYVLVVPANASSREELAADEFKVLFKRATNIDIPVILDNSGDSALQNENAKRISIGETSLITRLSAEEKKALGYDQSILGSDGVRIITKNNTVYLLGGTMYGTLYAVYDFMQICFNYEFYYRNCIEMDTNIKNLKLRDFDVTDIPDVMMRNYGNCISLHKKAWDFELDSGVVDSTDVERAMNRYRYITSTEIYLPIYTEKGGYELNYGLHNVYYYVHPNDNEGKWRANWLSNNAPANQPQSQELCYTAHGNEEDLTALVEACADKIIYSLTLDQWKDRSYVGFTIMDGGYQCTCDSCQEAYRQDGDSYAGAIIRVANRIMAMVKEWMANNGQADRELNMYFFAYGTTEKAPVYWDEDLQTYVPANESVKCRDDVYAYICTHNDSRSIYWAEPQSENAQDIEEIVKWRAVAGHMFNWFYQQRYVLYSAYFDTFSMMNTDMYSYVIENGGFFAFNQGDYRGETVTGFGVLNEYVYSKIMWDVTLDMETLCKKFFKAMYKDAAETMWDIFVSEREYSMTVSQDITVGEYNYSRINKASLYPYKARLLPLIEKYEKALSEIEILKKTAPAEYELVRQRINTEYVAPLYLTLKFYGSKEVRPFSNAKKLEYKAKLQAIASDMYFLCYEANPIGPNMLDFANGV